MSPVSPGLVVYMGESFLFSNRCIRASQLPPFPGFPWLLYSPAARGRWFAAAHASCIAKQFCVFKGLFLDGFLLPRNLCIIPLVGAYPGLGLTAI